MDKISSKANIPHDDSFKPVRKKYERTKERSKVTQACDQCRIRAEEKLGAPAIFHAPTAFTIKRIVLITTIMLVVGKLKSTQIRTTDLILDTKSSLLDLTWPILNLQWKEKT
ncbi:hypothetical protein BGAL_0690g00020 [Botrytis galanthina]|uniref:Uncharacterized protein n=1 Tax=Botrytis galanthina TaxID=278940 RepID=A0A4S8QMD6_9HELO|nr:hypothetical protein BGAL_0690g00020 [Botrytis galanthina]